MNGTISSLTSKSIRISWSILDGYDDDVCFSKLFVFADDTCFFWICDASSRHLALEFLGRSDHQNHSYNTGFGQVQRVGRTSPFCRRLEICRHAKVSHG